ncbi:MAG: hypothetical protein M3N47_14540, partial [Chloroflexota bacterium]|nr:hypothetical protein [Chloroflexota bacterium]
ALHHCVRGLKGVIAPTQVAVHPSTFDAAGVITEARLLARLTKMVEEVNALASNHRRAAIDAADRLDRQVARIGGADAP